MQARFLTKVVDNYQATKTQSSISPRQHNKQTQQDSVSHNTNSASQNSLNHTSQTPSSTDHENTAMESGNKEEEQLSDQSQVIGSYAFSDNDMWEKMFAEAGFRLNDGVFMPEAMED